MSINRGSGSRPSTPSGGLPPPPSSTSRRRLPRTSSQESSPSPVSLLDVNFEDTTTNMNPWGMNIADQNPTGDMKAVSNNGSQPRKPGLTKANSMYNKDSASMVPVSKTVTQRMSLPMDASANFGHPGYHPDLLGLDFSNVAPSNASSTSTLVEDSIKSIYPDISQAFRELNTNSPISEYVPYNCQSQNSSTLQQQQPQATSNPPHMDRNGSGPVGSTPFLPQASTQMSSSPQPHSSNTSNQPFSLTKPSKSPEYGWNPSIFNRTNSSDSMFPPQPLLNNAHMSPSNSYTHLSQMPTGFTHKSPSPVFNQNSLPSQTQSNNFAESFFGAQNSILNTQTPSNNINASPWPDPNPNHITSASAFDMNPFNNFNSSRNNFSTNSALPSMPYVPNISLPRPSSGADIASQSRDSSKSPIDNTAMAITITDHTSHTMSLAGFDDNNPGVRLNSDGYPAPQQNTRNGDLINLGMVLPEHEYLSLDYFDPLYNRGRRESVSQQAGIDEDKSTPTMTSQFSFGEAFPNANKEKQLKRQRTKEEEELIWTVSTEDKCNKPAQNAIGFEAFDFNTHGTAKFGSSEEEFMRPSTVLPTTMTSPAYDHIENENNLKKEPVKPERPPPWVPPKGKQYEHLRKRTFIDPESESFCQMVADLKKQYPSTEEQHNQGYLVNQIQECHIGSIQVKLVVHTTLATEPIAFTCDTNALVEHVISHVLYTASPANPQPDVENFILKIYDRTEYLCNDLPLAKFEYCHSCLKLGRDLNLQLINSQHVTRPFIRTKDDDEQMLYFPKEYINADGTAISLDSLTILLDTFYHEVDSLLRLVHEEEATNVRCKGVEQSVKAICHNLAKIETTDITKALRKLQESVTELNNPSKSSQGMFQDSVTNDEETQKAISVALRCSVLEDLEEYCKQLVEAVKTLIRMYCRTFLTNFFIGSSVEIPHDHLEVMNVQDNFIVCMASAHRIPTFWHGKFEEYKLVCSLYYGTKKLANDVCTTTKALTSNLCDAIVWDEWLQFDNTYLCNLPRETRLFVMLCGSRLPHPGEKEKGGGGGAATTGQKRLITYPLCAAAIQLFNEKGYLHQGPQLVPLMSGATSDPIMPSCKTLLPDSILLQVNLPDFERTIFFPVPLNSEIPSKQFKNLIPAIQTTINTVLEKESCSTFQPEEYEILWQYRHYLIELPSLLPRILKAARNWDWASLSEIYALLRKWKTLHPMQAFELLLPEFPDIHVRQFAAESLNRIPTDNLIDFLPQLIQALKFETYHNSPLAKLLLEQSCKSPRFAHQFFWLLKGVASQEVTFKRRYELMFVALASVAGDSLYREFKKQEQLVKIVTSLAEKVKAAKDRDATLRRELVSLHDMLESHGRVLLPYNPSVEVASLDIKSCSYFTSFTFPLKLVFKNSNPKADSHYVMFKVGDDLRQDMLTLQMIRIMDSLWLQQGLDLKMVTFACLATGPKKGILELITESETLRKIQISCGLTGSFKDRPIKEWLQKHNPTELEYRKAVENFTHSCAGYCVATYVLGVCDRHNDNIMIKQSGHMFHIDFSKFLGDSQMFGNFKRDRVPFVLTSDMAYVINDGGKQGDKFQHFVDLCCQAFNILRRHADLFRSLFILMARSGIPNVNERAVQYVQNALSPGQTDAQATATFTRMIEESVKSMFTQFNFFIHNLAQMKFSSHQEGALLSFVPKAYSEDTDGKITSVELHDCQKRYTPEKHYIFIVKIERENQKVPTYIFRHFSEFVEFRDKMNETFSLVTWPNLSSRLVIGRSNIRSVAESRKVEIDTFLKTLWGKAEEISRCELVYTFFHPLLRDEQEAETSNLNTTKLKESLTQRVGSPNPSGIQGDIKLSIQYKRDALQVMVMHVRGLAEVPELPSPYVKTYLLPDPDKQTKLKTKVVKNTSHPTFNELLQYQLPQLEIQLRQLQVTVWDRRDIKENNFLGAVYLRMRDLDLAMDNVAWHKLSCIQQMGS